MKHQGPKILATSTAVPKYTKDTSEILSDIGEHLKDHDERFRRKVLRIFEYAQVDRRYSIMPSDQVLAPLSFEEKNDTYVENVKILGQQVLSDALEKAKLSPKDMDFIITVSCTGFMIPSLDAYLINAMDMKQDIMRLPVTEMGCAAGVSAMIYAHQFLRANPNKRAAIVSVESPMSTFQHNDFSMANMVSAAIFGDGAACVILGPSDEVAPTLVDSEMFHFHDEIDMMGFKLTNAGFQMILSPEVPTKIEERFGDILHPFLAKNDLAIGDIDHLIFHPGGKKIVQLVEKLFAEMNQNLDDTKEVLRLFGNMSSATVLFVLDRLMTRGAKEGDRGLMLSFGPGFSAQRVLLEWK